MLRVKTTPRDNHIQKLEEISFEFHSLSNTYWDESVYYEFQMKQVLELEKATNDLYAMCLEAVQYVIDNNLYEKLCIDPKLIPLIEYSWNEETASIYGRFDFGYDGKNPPKMLEFNADTPTSLYECAVVQWYWLQDVAKDKDQFNSIHEKILAYWKGCVSYFNGETVHFTCIKDSIEDFTTVEYLRDLASQAGLKTEFIYIDEIGWDEYRKEFVDNNDNAIVNIFKLYPWEWLVAEEYGPKICEDKHRTEWIEPAWKSILSNKGILPILWELFPNHPNLLECYFDESKDMVSFVEKPIYSREGANVKILKDGEVIEQTEGDYGEEGMIYQQYFELPDFEGNYPIIGSWVIAGESAGMSVRESNTRITDNLSRFIPHLINN